MRIQALKKKLVEENLDGYLVTDVNNVYYFTEFLDIPGAALCLVVPVEGEATLFVSTLSETAANIEAKGCIVKQVKTGEKLVDKAVEEIKRLKFKYFGFDKVAVSTYLKFLEELKDTKFEEKTGVCYDLRRVKDAEEVALIRKAARLTDIGVNAAVEAVKPGIREYEVAAEAEYAMRLKGSSGVAFETIVASGVRSAYPHGLCTDKIIREGEFVTIDLGAMYRGYRCDITRTIVVGKPSRKQQELFNLVLNAQKLGIKSIHAGIKGRDVDGIVREMMIKAGYGDYFIHGLGHGVGLEIHEPPSLSQASEDTLVEGNVVTVEPGVYLPKFGGVRIEDTVLVLKDRAERFTKAPKKMTP